VAASQPAWATGFADGHLGPPIGKQSLPTAFTCHQQSFFLIFSSSFFLVTSYLKYNPTSKIGIILSFFAIFR
jgi:hypothetical protein